jgi:hypothetical protein
MKKGSYIKLALIIVFVLSMVVFCQSQGEASVSEFVDKYFDCTDPENFADDLQKTRLKFKSFFYQEQRFISSRTIHLLAYYQ